MLTIDRDNDLGIKAGLRGPVIGRKSTLSAALRLGLADPEESDTNAILGALHHHDRILDSGEPNDAVEVAILTGDERVGARSDRAIAKQLEEVISEFQTKQKSDIGLYFKGEKGKIIYTDSINNLLPFKFDSSFL